MRVGAAENTGLALPKPSSPKHDTITTAYPIKYTSIQAQEGGSMIVCTTAY